MRSKAPPSANSAAVQRPAPRRFARSPASGRERSSRFPEPLDTTWKDPCDVWRSPSTACPPSWRNHLPPLQRGGETRGRRQSQHADQLGARQEGPARRDQPGNSWADRTALSATRRLFLSLSGTPDRAPGDFDLDDISRLSAGVWLGTSLKISTDDQARKRQKS